MRPTRTTEARALLGVGLVALASACTLEPDYYVIIEGCQPGWSCVPLRDPPPSAPPPAEGVDDGPTREPTAPLPDGTTLRELSYRVVDATYTDATSAIVVVSDEPQQLIVIEDDGVSERRYALAAKPTSVRVSADGRLVGVGSEAGFAVFELATGTPVATCSAPANVTRIALTNDARVFVISGLQQPSLQALSAFDAKTCTLLLEAGAGADAMLELTASERTLYLSDGFLLKCGVDDSPGGQGISSCEVADISGHCDGFWLERGGTQLYTRCAARYRLLGVDVESSREHPAGNVPDVALVDSMIASAAHDRVVLLGRTQEQGASPGTRLLRIYDSVFLQQLALFGLPPLPAANGSATAYGRFVFADEAMKRAFVLVQAADASAARSEFGLATLPIPQDFPRDGGPDEDADLGSDADADVEGDAADASSTD